MCILHSFVPMGLFPVRLANPGTKVPGYFHRVPNGTPKLMIHDSGFRMRPAGTIPKPGPECALLEIGALRIILNRN